ncbi:MAG: type II toxin-antitoxin system RelB/DinJ family antitoxin [Candidatus Paceibacterota bacterium]
MTTKEKTTTKSAMVRARIEPAVKKRAEKAFEKIGISPSEAINVFFKRVAVEQAFPFSLHVPNAVTRKAMREMERREGLHSFESTEELFNWLDA